MTDAAPLLRPVTHGWRDLLLVLLLLSLTGGALRFCTANRLAAASERYADRWTLEDGSLGSAELVLEGDHDFRFVYRHWWPDRREETLTTYGVEGTWTTGMLGNHLHPHWTWCAAGAEGGAAERRVYEGGPVSWQRTRTHLRLGPGALPGCEQGRDLPRR